MHGSRLVYMHYQSFCDHSIGIFHGYILSFEGFVYEVFEGTDSLGPFIRDEISRDLHKT